MTDAGKEEPVGADPRTALADWANQSDEWVRFIVRQVLGTGRPLPANDIDYAYDLFRQEKSFDERVLPAQAALGVEVGNDEAELPLIVTKLAEVSGVNALVPGAVIEPHPGLTILYGENGTGKSGYSRIFKTRWRTSTRSSPSSSTAARRQSGWRRRSRRSLGGSPPGMTSSPPRDRSWSRGSHPEGERGLCLGVSSRPA